VNKEFYKRKFNYVYKITNIKNGKIYIGVHKTDNIDDGYMGSGKRLINSIKRNGLSNFKKEILFFFDTYQEALNKEKDLVNLEFVERFDTYNLRTGGEHGVYCEDSIRKMSINSKERWKDQEYRNRMLKHLSSTSRCNKISANIKKWIDNNPDKHNEKMLKINRDPEKIKKTADNHRGRKRPQKTKDKIKEKANEIRKDPSVRDKISGVGCMYIHNLVTGDVKRHHCGPIPAGWNTGTGPRKNKENYKDNNKGSFFVFDEKTLKLKRLQEGEEIPPGYIKGKPKK
jgi:hypothetical protein